MTNNDRNYYRMLDDAELMELAKSVTTNELAIVLAERLKKVQRKLEAGRYEVDSYRHEYDNQF